MSQSAAAPADTRNMENALPTALQVIHKEALEDKLVGKVIVITGATSGIGLETARALSITGATLVLTARDLKKAEVALHGILEADRVSLVEMDLSSLASVRTAAAKILASVRNQVNILINNAGVMGFEKRTLTKDGYEMTFATNHLGHFLFFELLKPALLGSASPSFHSRVVNVASCAHRATSLHASDNYNFEKEEKDYEYLQAYAQSKLANIYMSNEIDRRYGDKGLHATSVHPGAIMTNISRNMSSESMAQIMENKDILSMLKNPEEGAATTVIAAVGAKWENKGGKYLENCDEADRGPDDDSIFGSGWVRQTYDRENESRLWKDSLKMVDLEDDLA